MNRQPIHDLSMGVIDVHVKFQLCILKTVRMFVELRFFWVINPLFMSPLGYRRIVNPSTTCPGESLTLPATFQLFILKTVQMHDEFTFFWVINPLFLNHLVKHKIVNPSTTRHGESLSHWRTCEDSGSVSWKLCEWMLNLRFFELLTLYS